MPETVVLLAHGNQESGAWSHPKIKIITKAQQPLSAEAVRDYLQGGTAPEFSSCSLGNFGPVSDQECQRDIRVVPGKGPGFVDTGKRRGGDMEGYRIFVLRGKSASFSDFGKWAGNFGKVIILACRS